jgi:hypothetical protein
MKLTVTDETFPDFIVGGGYLISDADKPGVEAVRLVLPRRH